MESEIGCMQGTAKELQDVVMAALLQYQEILSKVVTEIYPDYFDSVSYQVIYKCLKRHYEEYLAIPSKPELAFLIKKVHTPDLGDINDIYKALDNAIDNKLSSFDFAFDLVADFIRRAQGEKALSKVVEAFDGNSIDMSKVVETLADAMTLNFTRTDSFNLADISRIPEIRRKSLGGGDTPIIVKFFIDAVNDSLQYNGLVPGTVNIMSAPTGFGKTTLLINQGVCVAQQGYKLLHVALGDMSENDLLLRYSSCFSGIATKKLSALSDEDLQKFIQKTNMSGFLANVEFVVHGADEVTAPQLIEEINTLQKRKGHFDVIIVDYDENISYDDTDMYNAGGRVYNKIALFAKQNSSVLFMAAQIKPEFWDQEVIPLNGLAESSKKQKIVDLIFTMGKPKNAKGVATLYIPKNRRGEEGGIFRMGITGSNCRMKHITNEEYLKRKQEEKAKRLSSDEKLGID